MSSLDPNWDPWAQTKPLEKIVVDGRQLAVGQRVRLVPQRRADVLDIALQGKTAVIEALEEDFDDAIHVAVVLDDDPGRDLGHLRQPGHRFFFKPSEVEVVE